MDAANIKGMSQQSLEALATELESAIPVGYQTGRTAEGVSGDVLLPGAALGGVISRILALVAALRTQDWKVIATAVRDLLNVLLADSGDGGISFATSQQALGSKINWDIVKSVLGRLLGMLLGM